jgi:hypothetical protein
MRTTSANTATTGRLFKVTAVSVTVAAMVTACGGGGGIAGEQSITLSGMAATGAPMSGATVVVKDSTGEPMQSCEPCKVESDGKFSIALKSTAKGPFVLLVTQETGDAPQVSMIDTATSARVNVTPITTMIAARLAPDGNPAELKSSDLSKEKIAEQTAVIKSMLKPLLAAAGVPDGDDPVTASFTADSTGVDKALDVLGKPSLSKDSAGKTILEFAVKTSGADDAADADNAPVKFTLSPGVVPVTPANITVASMTANLPVEGVSTKIQSLIQRMQACYATAPADRRASRATLASEITAEVCKGLFVDNDPSKFLHNNTVISASGATLPAGSGGRFTGAFKGIFNTVQGIKHDLPEYRYTVKNGNTTDATRPMEGDVVFTARWTVTDPNAGMFLGQSDVSEYHARIQNGALKLFGNQSKHDLDIRPQARREDMPAVADYAYLSTGYNIGISERRWNHDNNTATPKVSIYEQIVVTSPSGKTFTFKPIPGNNYDYLGLVRSNGTVSSSATIRLNATYQNAATTGHPSERFTKEFWANKDDWSDEKIAAIPAQGNWKFDISLTDAFVNEPSNGVASKTFNQFRRSINRAPTVAELKAIQWPELKDPLKAAFVSQASSQGYVSVSSSNVGTALSVDGWDVGTRAWSPTYVKVYGSTWDEGADVSSTARKVTIRCSGTAAHCEKVSGTSTNTGLFINAGYGYLQMTGRDNKRLNMSLNYSTRKTDTDATQSATTSSSP